MHSISISRLPNMDEKKQKQIMDINGLAEALAEALKEISTRQENANK